MADASSSRTSANTRLASKVALTIAAAAIAWNAQPLAVAGIHGYRRWLSPVAAAVGIRCRFTPTCSRYAETVIVRDGILKGGLKSLARIARCGPWTKPGTIDNP